MPRRYFVNRGRAAGAGVHFQLGEVGEIYRIVVNGKACHLIIPMDGGDLRGGDRRLGGGLRGGGVAEAVAVNAARR